jgi:midasin (ATPase involved in ribosome maturation)
LNKEVTFSKFIKGKLSYNTTDLNLLYDNDRPFTMHVEIPGNNMTEMYPSLTIEDLCGYVIPNNGSTGSTTPWITQDSDFLRAYTSGWVIKIDEVNNFSNSVLIGLNDAFYGKHRAIKYQGKTIPCHPKTVIICTTNFGYQGNNPMNEAFVDRFYPILMTDLVEDNYAAYLSKKNPSLDATAIKEYTKFMFKLMTYMEQTFENQDRFSPNTPAISVRRFSEVLMTALASKSFKQVLGDVIYAIIHGVEDNKTKTQAVLAQFDKDITTIEQMFFMNKQIINDAKKTLKSLLSIGVAASVNTNTSSTNADDIFDKANNMDSSSANSIIDGLNNINW